MSKKKTGKRVSNADIRKECDRVDAERIRERVLMPVEKRMNFLRVRLPNGGSAL
jgi:hypothetical protein